MSVDAKRFGWLSHPALSESARLAGLNQGWRMFAPHPMLDDGWYVIPARLADGSEVDLFRGGAPVTREKPERVFADYPTHRWLTFNLGLRQRQGHAMIVPYLEWLRRRWDAEHPRDERVVSLEMIYMQEDTRFDTTEADPRPVKMWAGEVRSGRLQVPLTAMR